MDTSATENDQPQSSGENTGGNPAANEIKKISNYPSETADEDAVIAAEKERFGIGNHPHGIAFSGGGIRSASFGLGVMQAFVANDKFSTFNYMSTVSGGGYLGSALTWALHQDPKAGLGKKDFPLGQVQKSTRQQEKLKTAAAAKSAGRSTAENATGQAEIGNKLLDYIRQHSNYLTPTNALDIVSLAAAGIRSMIISLTVYISLLMIIMTGLVKAGLFNCHLLHPWLPCKTGFPYTGIWFPLAIGCMLLYGILAFVYSLSTVFAFNAHQQRLYSIFVFGQKLIGYLWKFAATFAVIGSLAYFTRWMTMLGYQVESMTGLTLWGAITGAWQYVKAQRNEKSSGAVSSLLIYAGAFALLYGVLLVSFNLAGYFNTPGTNGQSHWLCFWLMAGGGILLALVVNLNMVGPHRIWRNRLMEAFLPNKKAVENNQWEKATEADNAKMQDMCWDAAQKKPLGPYHIINTNIVLAKGEHVKFQGRGGDNFIISPMYCGSYATGWKRTDQYQSNGGREIRLATAMATSAAALNPNAAVSGEGATRNTVVSILLSFLNLRLGYWANNPKYDQLPFAPNFLVPGFSTEVCRSGFSEDSRHVQLSDGGHFENLGIYELIRRKCKLVVVSDGGADAAFNFDDLANAVEKVRVDFGVKIRFRDHCDLDGILPGTLDGGSNADFVKKYALAKRAFAIADIHYPGGKEKGVLVYLKLAMIDKLSTDIYAYKGVHPEFPHQSTADQFFDEKQFEAYRELGYHVCWQMMEWPGTIWESKDLAVKGNERTNDEKIGYIGEAIFECLPAETWKKRQYKTEETPAGQKKN
jgi:hypothetical protein